MAKKGFRRFLPLVLFAAVTALAAVHPPDTRGALEYAIALWWNHLVPVLLPGYVLGQFLLSLWPRPPLYALALLAFLTFPPLVALILLDWHRQGRIADRQLLPLLLYTNIYNPLIFPHPSLGLTLDAALMVTALIIFPPGNIPPSPPVLVPFKPRQWIADAMTWTTIMGLTTMGAWLGHHWLPWLGTGWIIDPLGIHWSWQTEKAPPLALFWTAFGGLGYWLPLFLKAPDLQRRRLLLYRLLQSGLGALMVLMAQGYWPY